MAAAASLWVKVGLVLTDFDRQLGKLSRKMNRIGSSLQQAGSTLTRGLSLPLAAAGGAAVKFAADFDQSMTRSIAIMGDTGQAMKEDLAKTARDVAKESTFSARETAEAYYYLASAGLDAAQSMKALPAVTQFATAGAFDLSLATDLLTDAQSALGLTVKNVTDNYNNMVYVSDRLVAATAMANATTQQFSEALTNKAGLAMKNLGKDIEEGLAVLAAFADQGVKGAEAGTQLFIAYRDVQKAARASKKEHRDFYDAVFDVTGEMRHMADVLEFLESKMGDMSDEMKQAYLIDMLGFTSRSVQATLALVGLSDKIREYDDRLHKAGGTTQRVSDIQLSSFSNQLKILWGRFQDVGITIGNALMPAFRDLMKLAESLVETFSAFSSWLKDLDEKTHKLIVGVGLLVVAIGPLLVGIGALVKIVGVATLGLKSLFGIIAAHPIGLLITAIGLTTAAYVAQNAIVNRLKASTDKLNDSTDGLVRSGLEIKIAETERRISKLIDTVENLAVEYRHLRDENPFGAETAKTLARVRELDNEINYLKEELKDLNRQIGIMTGPVLGDLDKKTRQATRNFGDFGAAVDKSIPALRGFGEELKDNKQDLESWGDGAIMVTDRVSAALEGVGSIVQTVFDGFARALGRSLSQALVYGKSFADSFEEQMKHLAAVVIEQTTVIMAQFAATGLVEWMQSSSGFGGLNVSAGSSPIMKTSYNTLSQKLQTARDNLTRKAAQAGVSHLVGLGQQIAMEQGGRLTQGQAEGLITSAFPGGGGGGGGDFWSEVGDVISDIGRDIGDFFGFKTSPMRQQVNVHLDGALLATTTAKHLPGVIDVYVGDYK